jgi:hypothetical protein
MAADVNVFSHTTGELNTDQLADKSTITAYPMMLTEAYIHLGPYAQT